MRAELGSILDEADEEQQQQPGEAGDDHAQRLYGADSAIYKEQEGWRGLQIAPALLLLCRRCRSAAAQQQAVPLPCAAAVSPRCCSLRPTSWLFPALCSAMQWHHRGLHAPACPLRTGAR